MQENAEIERVIIDTDCADDDLFASCMLLYLHELGELRVEGITPVLGIHSPGKGAIVMKRLVEYLSIYDVPIHAGANQSLFPDKGHYFTEAEWWEEWEKAIIDLPHKVNMPSLNQQQIEEVTKSEHGVDFIIRKLNESPNKISILCLGPLTNLALAIKKDKNILKKAKQIVLMGGNVTAPGNTPNKVSEWNFYADPSAVQLFLENIEGVPVFMCGLEIAHENSIPRPKQLELAEMRVEMSNKKLERIVQVMQGLIHNSSYSCTFDPVAAAVLINKDLYTFEKMRLHCGLEAPNEAKLTPVTEGGGEVYVGQHFDGENYFKLLQTLIERKE